MDAETALLINIVALFVGLLISYVVIRLAVLHAMRAHSVWFAEGGVEKVIARRNDRAARNEAELARYRQETRGQS